MPAHERDSKNRNDNANGDEYEHVNTSGDKCEYENGTGTDVEAETAYDDDVKEGNAIEVNNDNHMKWEGEREKWE